MDLATGRYMRIADVAQRGSRGVGSRYPDRGRSGSKRPEADVQVRQLNVRNKHQSGRLTLGLIQDIAFVIETPSVRAILEHIGEPTRPPVISPARAPPAWEEDPIALDLGDDPLAQPELQIEFDQRIQW